MSASPAVPLPTISPGEMQLLLSRAGLVLNPGQVADLVLAWRQVAGLIALIPHDRPLADDAAYAFRLPPPARAAAIVVRPRPAAKSKATAKSKAKSKAPASRKAAAKRRTTAKPAPRKRARRGR
jgi:hypothetical protein